MTTPCELLVRAGSGDRAAFSRLYDVSCRPAYRLALCLTGDPGAADDLLILSYLEAWRTAPRFDPARGSAVGWLLATVQRLGQESRRGPGLPAEAGWVLSTRIASAVVASTPR